MNTAANTCAIIVETAAPITPYRNTTTNKTSVRRLITEETVLELIDKITVSEAYAADGKEQQAITIQYKFVAICRLKRNGA